MEKRFVLHVQESARPNERREIGSKLIGLRERGIDHVASVTTNGQVDPVTHNQLVGTLGKGKFGKVDLKTDLERDEVEALLKSELGPLFEHCTIGWS